MYNAWFMVFAPEAYRSTRIKTTGYVEEVMVHTTDFLNMSPADIQARPGILSTLRMSTAPPIAGDRLTGLAGTTRSLVETLEQGRLPPRMPGAELTSHLQSLCRVLGRLLDRDLFPWLETGLSPTEGERIRAASVVADRLCGASTDPIIRNAQEIRQLALIESYLLARGYTKRSLKSGQAPTEMEPGTFAFRMNVVVNARNGTGSKDTINMPVDAVIQPRVPRSHGMPILVEAKSAGDYANPNKRRKEEATKIAQLRHTFGNEARLILFLCGYFDTAYLGYEAAEGLDWIWEHRIDDFAQLGI